VTRVAVIGAGVGGLACAARLAARGHEVAVFEQAGRVGGKLGLIEQDGYTFDTGPSVLTWPSLVSDVLALADTPESAAIEFVPLEPQTRYYYPDGVTFDAHGDPDRMRRSFDRALGLGTGAAWTQLMQRAERMWDAIEQPVLSEPVPDLSGMANRAARISDMKAIAPHRTLRGIAREYLHHPHQQQYLERFATYTGSDPRKAPAVQATIPWLEQHRGVWYVPGGLYRIADALRSVVEALGGTVHTDAKVDTIAATDEHVTGVTLSDGTRYAADVVVSNIEPRVAYHLLEHPSASKWRAFAERPEPSLSGFVLLLGLEGRTPDLTHHTVLFCADYDAEFDQIFGPSPQPVTDPTIYISAPDDPALTPDGGEAWFVLVNAARQGPVDWDAGDTSQRYADHLLDLLAKRGFDVRHRIRTQARISPADLQRRTGAAGGAIYGSSSNGWRAAFLRPANKTPLDGLYLVGGSSHPGGGIPLVLKSAEITDRLIG
jgi:phytoene desaturase